LKESFQLESTVVDKEKVVFLYTQGDIIVGSKIFTNCSKSLRSIW